MKEQNVALDRGSDAFRRLAELIRRGMLESTRRARRRLSGDFGENGADPVFAGMGASTEPTAPVQPVAPRVLTSVSTLLRPPEAARAALLALRRIAARPRQARAELVSIGAGGSRLAGLGSGTGSGRAFGLTHPFRRAAHRPRGLRGRRGAASSQAPAPLLTPRSPPGNGTTLLLSSAGVGLNRPAHGSGCEAAAPARPAPAPWPRPASAPGGERRGRALAGRREEPGGGQGRAQVGERHLQLDQRGPEAGVRGAPPPGPAASCSRPAASRGGGRAAPAAASGRRSPRARTRRRPRRGPRPGR